MFRKKNNRYALISISSATLDIIKIELDLPNKTIVTDMTVLGDVTFFKAKVKKNNYVFYVNWKTGEHKLIPINIPNFKKKQIRLSEFQIIEEYNELILYIKVFFNKKQSDIFVLNLSDKGKNLGLFNLSSNITENLTNVSTSKIGDNNYIITGTYASEKLFTSEGIFIAEIENQQLKYFKKTNYLDLENFLSYLPQRKENKINKKKEKKRKKGKELKTNFNIASHEVIELEDGYLTLGEAYYPTYKTESYSSTTYINGVPTTTTKYRSVFDGYQYTHAILAKYDFEGNLVWDEIFKMWPSYKPFYQKKFISISNRDKTSIKLVFSSYSSIKSKSFDYDGNTLLDNQYDIIEKKHEDDEYKKYIFKY